jgi:hypothetical protein
VYGRLLYFHQVEGNSGNFHDGNMAWWRKNLFACHLKMLLPSSGKKMHRIDHGDQREKHFLLKNLCVLCGE